MTEEGFVLTRELCAQILSEDARQRRAMAWPLLGTEELFALRARVEPAKGPVRVAPDLVVARSVRRGLWKARDNDMAETAAADLEVEHLFELAEQHRAAHRHDVELVVAGGAVCGQVARRGWTDIDVFFVSASKNTVAAEQLLRALLATYDDLADESMLMMRNGFTVTVESGEGSPVQFVLRLYPSVALVLGGFDLGASQAGLVCEEGRMKLVFTHLGAWSLALCANIVDVTRRSVVACAHVSSDTFCTDRRRTSSGCASIRLTRVLTLCCRAWTRPSCTAKQCWGQWHCCAAQEMGDTPFFRCCSGANAPSTRPKTSAATIATRLTFGTRCTAARSTFPCVQATARRCSLRPKWERRT
jgi:hypothetical protein